MQTVEISREVSKVNTKIEKRMVEVSNIGVKIMSSIGSLKFVLLLSMSMIGKFFIET